MIHTYTDEIIVTVTEQYSGYIHIEECSLGDVIYYDGIGLTDEQVDGLKELKVGDSYTIDELVISRIK